MIKRQKTLIIALGAGVLLLLALYLAVLRPLFLQNDSGTPLETLEGEQVGVNDRYLMFEHVERDRIESIRVENEHGSFEFYRNAAGSFFLRGYEDFPYDAERFSVLVTSTGYTIAKTKVMDNATEEQLADYGLTKETASARYTLTTTDGAVYNVRIGEKIVTGGGFYAMLEGRASVYVLDTSFEDSVLVDALSYIDPILFNAVSEDDFYTISDFCIYKNNDMTFAVVAASDDEMTNPDATIEHYVVYPGVYSVNSTLLYTVYRSFTGLEGTRVVLCEPTEAQYNEYGFDKADYAIAFTYQGIDCVLLFKDTGNGTYYVYSPAYGLVCEAEKSAFSYLEYDLIAWLDGSVYSGSINLVDAISIESKSITETFHLSGTGDNMLVRGESCGEINIAHFRSFYRVILSLMIQDYVSEDLSEDEVKALTENDASRSVTLTIDLRSGRRATYEFYPYSTRHTLLVTDGDAEFYVLRDQIEKLESDALKITQGLTVDPDAKN